MPRGRISRIASVLRNAAHSVVPPAARRGFDGVEALESRRLLTTLTGGQIFEYVDARNRIMRITMVGTIEAEFTAVRVRSTDNSLVVRDLVPPPPPNTRADGADLFNIYINAAGPDGQIIINEVTGPRRIPAPFGGAVPGFKINDNDGNSTDPITVDVPGGTGGVTIGARTRDASLIDGNDEANFPIDFVPYRQPLGVRPATRGITAGIESAPGVSLDKIMIGGTITGRVFIGGSVNTFYAGNVFTGDTDGLFLNSNTTRPNNFFIGGNLRNFLVTGSVGTDAVSGTSETNYRTGFDMRVGGRLGNVEVLGDSSGSYEIVNNPEIEIETEAFEEIEFKPLAGQTPGTVFLLGELAVAGFNNDDFENIQFGSSHGSAITGDLQALDFAGDLNSTAGDSVDYYALPLIAGQRPTILLQGLGLAVGVFDPLGRLVTSDIADFGGNGGNEQFQFTATMPGTYRLAVGGANNTTFANAGNVFGTYTLSVQNYGQVALGGLQFGQEGLFNEPDQGVFVRTGDLGAITSGGNVLASPLTPFSVARGNLREIDSAGDIGTANTANPVLPPSLIVPRGSVGLLRATGLINVNADAVNADPLGTGAEPLVDRIVGGDYQRIIAGGALSGNFTARRAISHVTAGTVSGSTIFFANADRVGEDGRIDLIDVTGDFGSLNLGGPALYTGPGGNVKYLRVGGVLYRDRAAFGSTIETTRVGQPGESLTFTDDSGAVATIAPGQIIGAPPTTGGAPTVNPGTLTARLYGVRESGGSVLVDLTSTAGISISSRSNGGQFDIAELISNGVGTPTTTVVTGATPLNPNGFARVGYLTGTGTAAGVSVTPALANVVNIAGRAPVNVMSLQGTNLTSVVNNTAGEMAGIDAATLGVLRAQSIGYIKGSTPTTVLAPTNILAAALPFNPFTYGVNVNGSVIEVSARESIGNFYAANGAVGLLRANADGRNTRGSVDGIIGTVAAQRFINVDVGRGLLSAGTGGTPQAGIYAITGVGLFNTSIDQVLANNADIRGTIASEGTIGNINVRNGSLIGASVLTVTDISQAVFTNRGLVLTDPSTGLNTFALRGLSVVGNGGIIGSLIGVGNFAAIDVRGGFGILDSSIRATATGRPNGVISTDGLGIRDTFISAGGSLNRLQARGNGSRLNLRSYSASVRSAERGRFDANTGRSLNASNDLYRNLGLSRGTPVLSGVTNSGIIEDVVALGNGELQEMTAFVIRAGVENTLLPVAQSFPMRVAFANRTGRIFASGGIDGLRVTTGELDELNTGGNFALGNVDVAGRIESVAVGGIFRGSSTLNARGAEGSIGSIFVRRGLLGQVQSAGNIDLINAGTVGSTIQTTQRIANLTVRGSVLTGAFVRASRGIGILSIGGDVQNGATISASSYGTRTVGGRILGRIVDT
ncbi:MAG TPA: hypothetical protein VF624_17380 [Tepidisphaeraceae bacterium]